MQIREGFRHQKNEGCDPRTGSEIIAVGEVLSTCPVGKIKLIADGCDVYGGMGAQEYQRSGFSLPR